MPAARRIGFTASAGLRAGLAIAWTIAAFGAAWMVERRADAGPPAVAPERPTTSAPNVATHALSIEATASFDVAVWVVTIDGKPVVSAASDARTWRADVASAAPRELVLSAEGADPLASDEGRVVVRVTGEGVDLEEVFTGAGIAAGSMRLLAREAAP